MHKQTRHKSQLPNLPIQLQQLFALLISFVIWLVFRLVKEHVVLFNPHTKAKTLCPFANWTFLVLNSFYKALDWKSPQFLAPTLYCDSFEGPILIYYSESVCLNVGFQTNLVLVTWKFLFSMKLTFLESIIWNFNSA